eukprot:UN14487
MNTDYKTTTDAYELSRLGNILRVTTSEGHAHSFIDHPIEDR